MELPENVNLRNAYRRVQLIGGALGISLILYAGVVELLSALGRPEAQLGGRALDLLRIALLVAAFGIVVVTGRVKRHLLAAGSDLRRAITEVLVPSERYRRMTMTVIVSLALAESVAVFGLVLFLVGGNRLDFYGLWFISLALFLYHFPSYGRWAEWYGEWGRLR